MYFMLLNFEIGKGVPNNLAVSNNQTTPVSASLVPSVEAAADSYHEHQGHLTIASQFGSDPLRGRQDLILLREQQFLQRFSLTQYQEIAHNWSIQYAFL